MFWRFVAALAFFTITAPALAGNSGELHKALQEGHDVPTNVSDEQLACVAEGGTLSECFAASGDSKFKQGVEDLDNTGDDQPFEDMTPDE